MNAYRASGDVAQEEDVRAERGAYFVVANLELVPKEEKEWFVIADVTKGPSDVVYISECLKNEKNLKAQIFEDIELGTKNLLALTTAADGKQVSADKRKNTRHYANVLFNIMRGGIFDANYTIEKQDFSNYLSKANKAVFKAQKDKIAKLTDEFTVDDLKDIAWKSDDKNFARLCFEYLPLKFSRRHGDPSRPWNKFSINTRSEIDGSKILDYQGNWRDIFQNWEALAHAYPKFMEGMIHKFLNATTFDGYNPYRVTKEGFDWEAIEPDDPWSYIGYWGDHQIIYLLKFLEFIEKYYPKTLATYFDKDYFVYANVPYVIKDYKDILKNPKDTIDFDEKLDAEIRKRREHMGADGTLLLENSGAVYRVNLIEKLLATLLAKCSNFIPEAGIWLTTQRPEWNDANNALVGNGVSMVTLYYMRRFFTFFHNLLESAEVKKVSISAELHGFFMESVVILNENQGVLKGAISNNDRKKIIDGLGGTASDYRKNIYEKGFSATKKELAIADVAEFSTTMLAYLDHSIEANQREDKLYHAYNLMTLENKEEISVSYLSEMLEGQVAVLSSGYLSSKQALEVLDALKASKLFREDQYSYILYPNKELPRFTERNNIPEQAIKNSTLLQLLLKDGDKSVLEQDCTGVYHFNGNFNNADSLEKALSQLGEKYSSQVNQEKEALLQVFESVFNHKAFTGRSGTFYGYEGLGSIYWHMVSKLLLAAQECCLKAIEEKATEEIIGRLLEHYYEINEGIGVHKSPELYGAFSTDPYSHTPGGKGAQQPGMTGQVKEDILSRFGELGVMVNEGKIHFAPWLLLKDEFLEEVKSFDFIDVKGVSRSLGLNKNELCFTYCQVPIIYKSSIKEQVEVFYANGESEVNDGLTLSAEVSAILFERTGAISKIVVEVNK